MSSQLRFHYVVMSSQLRLHYVVMTSQLRLHYVVMTSQLRLLHNGVMIALLTFAFILCSDDATIAITLLTIAFILCSDDTTIAFTRTHHLVYPQEGQMAKLCFGGDSTDIDSPDRKPRFVFHLAAVEHHWGGGQCHDYLFLNFWPKQLKVTL